MMNGPAPARIFISYSRKDGVDTATILRKQFEANNFSVWQDLIALEGGRDWWSQIEKTLRSKELQHVVLALTPAALASKVVIDEIRLARLEGKTVSPVKGPGIDLAKVPRWIGHVYDLEIADQRGVLMRVLAGPSTQARVPMMAPEPSSDFVQRPVEFGALKRKLLDVKGDAVAITAALRGAGGYGKTTLACALAHDPDIQDAYFDGILWVELGERLANLPSIISDLVETITGTRPGLESLNAAANKLSETLGDRRILLVIDDAWREQDLRPFLRGGPNATRLITTRRDDILPLNTQRQPVDAMRAGEALALLAQGLPDDQTLAQRQALEALAARLGEWAQLLKLVNGFLRDRVVKGHQALDQAITGVNKRLSEKGLVAFDACNEVDRTNAIARTIDVSLDLLSVRERARFAELSVFPEDVDVPIGLAARLWGKTGGLDEAETEDLLVRLEGLSLLLALDLGRRSFRFHDTVRQFLQVQPGKRALAALHKTFLQAMEPIGADTEEAVRRYYYLYRLAHLSEASERVALDALLADPSWLQAKLNALENVQYLIADYERYGQGEVQDLIGRTLRLISGICTRDKRQLLPQLHGRLLPLTVTAPFCAVARELAERPVLLVSRASLTPPGAEIMRFEGHHGNVNALALLPDGRLASGSSDNTVRLWDLRTGAEVAKLEGHRNSVNALAVLLDGRLVSASYDNTARLWDLTTGTETAKLEGLKCFWAALAVLPDGLLASDGSDSTVKLWNSDTSAEIAELKGHRSGVTALAVLPDGCLASGSYDHTVRLWDLKTGTETTRFEVRNGGAEVLVVLPDGRLASGCHDGTIRLWDVKTGAETAKLEGHSDSVTALVALPDGHLASGSDDKSVRLWDTKTGAETARLDGHAGPVGTLAVLAEGRLASGSWDKTIRLWDLKTRTEAASFEGHDGPVQALAVLPDGNVVSGSWDSTIRLWDRKTGAEVAKFVGHDNWVLTLASLPDGRLASGSRDHTIRLWDLRTGAEVGRLQGHQEWVRQLAVLPDGRLASCSDDNTIRFWDLKTCVEVARLEVHDEWMTALAVLPDGRLASGSRDSTIRFWDLKTGTEVARFEDLDHWVVAFAMLPDGRLASCLRDKTIRFWDLEIGAEVVKVDGYGDSVNALAVLPNRRLASCSDDKTIRLWDLKSSAAEITRLEIDYEAICVAALPDCRLVVGDNLGRLHWLEFLE